VALSRRCPIRGEQALLGCWSLSQVHRSCSERVTLPETETTTLAELLCTVRLEAGADVVSGRSIVSTRVEAVVISETVPLADNVYNAREF
jgi:hypothetical protein